MTLGEFNDRSWQRPCAARSLPACLPARLRIAAAGATAALSAASLPASHSEPDSGGKLAEEAKVNAMNLRWQEFNCVSSSRRPEFALERAPPEPAARASPSELAIWK